ncbi:type IVB secretion system protein IcmH/DotU [Inquilinus limosus]|uniref:type IVB secretion system protein IcmH/DotU n=1 Tax=Inquilinus limosus TaxID=171674 RepID=UPI00040EF357|nr:type IVB secretion system protein IcmH/DotU [Inquilinus limosus]
MVDDDPFADPKDNDRTVIRPRPGGPRPAAVVSGKGPAGEGEPTQTPRPAGPRPRLAAGLAEDVLSGAVPIAPTGVNAVVQAATPLLALAVRLKNRAVHRDVQLLRERVVSEIRAFERNALAAGATADAIRAARYGLCATIDDLVLNTPWGSQSLWTKQSMVSTFYNETWGGERFFDILDHLMKDPERTLDILELYYVCLALGFEGRYRVEGRGPARLAEIRDSLYRAIHRRRGERESALSPHWTGVSSERRKLGRLVPLWVIGAATAVILLAAFFGFQWFLNAAVEPAMAATAQLPPTGPVVIERPAPIEKPPPQVVVVKETSGGRLKRFLEPEIREGLVSVEEDAQSVRVRISGNGLFASASDSVMPERMAVLTRIGNALKEEPGQVVIEGHTDNQPIRTLRFPSNWQLSQARAESVRKILDGIVQEDSRFSVEAKADTVPLAANDSADGRARNRRIEVVLLKPQSGG